MLKNVLIISAIIIVGILGVSSLSNQPSQKINQTVSPSPANVIINNSQTASPSASAVAAENFITMNDGLKIEDLKVGTGSAVVAGNTVTVNYLGTLQDGTKFDSSYDRNAPFTTQIGVGQVIKGWDEGIVGMKTGGKRKLIIPPSLGYGDQATGSIPPNSTLTFEVELLGIK